MLTKLCAGEISLWFLSRTFLVIVFVSLFSTSASADHAKPGDLNDLKNLLKILNAKIHRFAEKNVTEEIVPRKRDREYMQEDLGQIITWVQASDGITGWIEKAALGSAGQTKYLRLGGFQAVGENSASSEKSWNDARASWMKRDRSTFFNRNYVSNSTSKCSTDKQEYLAGAYLPAYWSECFVELELEIPTGKRLEPKTHSEIYSSFSLRHLSVETWEKLCTAEIEKLSFSSGSAFVAADCGTPTVKSNDDYRFDYRSKIRYWVMQ